MKLFESQHCFAYPWNQVTAANWQKYPNELATHVVSVDILNRLVDPVTHVLRTERLIACKQGIPRWLRLLVGVEEYSYVREVSEVDLANKTLVMKLANMTMSHLLLVNETVTYKPHADTQRTIFQQEAEITAFSPMQRICNKLEEWTIERFGQNAKVGKAGFESVLDSLLQKWEELGTFVKDMSTTLLKEIDDVNDKTHEMIHEVTDKTTGVISEVGLRTSRLLRLWKWRGSQ